MNSDMRDADFEEKRELRHGYGLLISRTCDTWLILETHGDPSTSIKHPISGQSTPVFKGCMDIIMFDMVYTPFSY